MTGDAGVSVADRVRQTMVRSLDLNVEPDALSDDLSLYSPLIQMDSLSLLELMIALEDEFGCGIDDEDVMAADLENVGSLVGLVNHALSSAAPGMP